MEDGNVKLKNFNSPIHTENLVSMEIRLRSSGLFSRTHVIGNSPENPDKLARSKHWTWEIWRSNHLYNNGQRHRVDKRRKWLNLCFELRTSQGIHDEILARIFFGPGGTLSFNTPDGKWDSTATQMVERFKETGHPVFKSMSALSRGILNRKNKRHTIHCERSTQQISAQYLRSSHPLVWRVRSEAEWNRVDYGANSKEWWSRFWNQTARTTSELRNTGESNPIYKTLRWCVILWKSLYWNVLQNRCRRRWWFLRSNSSM